jgi:hypothetical protein
MNAPHSRKFRSLGIGAAIAVGASLGLLAPAAASAAPSNDNFANRESLGNVLPVHRTESNVEATREAGEEINGFAKGHSIWWEWEAPTTGWTTVSVCGSTMMSYVKVFEGTELGHLTPLTGNHGNGDEGPQCWASQSTYTFEALAGHHYVIGADGNGFYVPPPPPAEPVIPSGEGTIALAIEATPPPPNDSFAAPIRLGESFHEGHQSPFEAPSGELVYFEQAHGYNWGASKEAGEPDHGGDPGGASVWYAWTPPVSGEARISLESGGPGLIALYQGSALGGLTPIASVANSYYPIAVPVTAGVEYRIAVDGSQTAVPSQPWRSFMGSFQLSLRLSSKVPLACPAGGGGCGGASPPLPAPPPRLSIFPKVRLGAHPVDVAGRAATFRFSSPTAGAAFRCKLDRQAYRACISPLRLKRLKPGKHVFRVLATLDGTTSAKPATVHFSVPVPQRRHHKAG